MSMMSLEKWKAKLFRESCQTIIQNNTFVNVNWEELYFLETDNTCLSSFKGF